MSDYENPHLKGDGLRFPAPEVGYSNAHDKEDFEKEWRRVMRIAAYNRRKLWSDTMTLPGAKPLALAHWGAFGLFQRPHSPIPSIWYLEPHNPNKNIFGSLATVPTNKFADMFTDDWTLLKRDMDEKLNVVRAAYSKKSH